MIRPEIKQKWLAALRSGEYKQGTERMVVEEEGEKCYCCLGVLAKLYCDETGADFGEYVNVSGNEIPAMTSGFQEWIGLTVTQEKKAEAMRAPHYVTPEGVYARNLNDIAGYSPSVTIGGRNNRASHFNDRGNTFGEIANAIEAQL